MFCKLLSPSDPERDWYHSRWNASGIGIVIPRFRVELQFVSRQFPVKPSAQASAYSALADSTDDLVRRKESIEKDPEERIKEEHGDQCWLRELYRASVVTDATHQIRINFAFGMQTQPGIRCDGPQPGVTVRHLRFRQYSFPDPQSVIGVIN
jgi:hypothetical protein